MKAAGWVTAAVIVGPRVSRWDLARLRVACAVVDLILHGVQARHVHEDHSLPAGMVPDLIEIVLHSAVFPRDAGVGPHSAAEASQPSISVSCLRSFARRAYSAARRQASSAAADLAWFQYMAASSCRVWQSPSSSGPRANSLRNSGSA